LLLLNVFTSPRFRLGWILIAIGLVNALFWTAYRWNFENTLNHAQITVDIDDTRSLSDAYSIPQTQMLKDLKERGARSLALYDQTLGTLRDNARIAISPRESAERLYPDLKWSAIPPLYRFLITSSDQKIIAQIWPRLVEQSASTSMPLRIPMANGSSGILVPNSKQLFNDAQVGFDPDQVKLAKDNGYFVTARVSNSLNLNPKRLNVLLDDVQQTGAKVVIFAEDEVVGYDTLIAGAAREMRRRGLIFTNVEFSKQRGAEDFAMNTEGDLVRLHTVNADEASRAKPEVLVDRFVRAVKERDMRVIYVRLIRQEKGEPKVVLAGDKLPELELEKSAYQQNLDFVAQVSEELQRQAFPIAWIRPGFQMGAAQAFGDYPENKFQNEFGGKGAKVVRFLMLFLPGLAVVGATLLLINVFFDLSKAAQRNWLWTGLVMVGGLSLSAGMGAKLLGLQAGLVFPVVAILWGGLPLVWEGMNGLEGEHTPARVAWFGFKILAKTTFITLIGGLLVVAFLNNWRYMSKADEFLGEKATQFLPLLLLPYAFLGEIFPHRVEEKGAAQGRQLAKSRLMRALEEPFTARIAIVSLIVLAGGYIWMARFGNESGMEISPIELKLRATLEKVFITRPRTKEIFMGHPAFLVAVYYMLRRQKWLAWGALVLATIGQTDVFNTMCHIHTPVFYCLWRSVTGVILGAIGGWVVLIVLEKIASLKPVKAVMNGDVEKSANFTF
jgi:hypothetical protein